MSKEKEQTVEREVPAITEKLHKEQYDLYQLYRKADDDYKKARELYEKHIISQRTKHELFNWTVFQNDVSVYHINNPFECICSFSEILHNRKGALEYADAIVAAINNTYGEGINPLAVPEMFLLLKEINTYYKNKTLLNGASLTFQHQQEIFMLVEKVLKKAELK